MFPFDVYVHIARWLDFESQIRLSQTCNTLHRRLGLNSSESTLSRHDKMCRVALKHPHAFTEIHANSTLPIRYDSLLKKCTRVLVHVWPERTYDMRSHSIPLKACTDERLHENWNQLTFRRDLEPKHVDIIRTGMNIFTKKALLIDITCPYIDLWNWAIQSYTHTSFWDFRDETKIRLIEEGYQFGYTDLAPVESRMCLSLRGWDHAQTMDYTQIRHHVLNDTLEPWFVAKYKTFLAKQRCSYTRMCTHITWDIAQHYDVNYRTYWLALSAPIEQFRAYIEQNPWEGHPGHQIVSLMDHILRAFCERCSEEKAHLIARHATETDWENLGRNKNLTPEFFEKYIQRGIVPNRSIALP